MRRHEDGKGSGPPFVWGEIQKVLDGSVVPIELVGDEPPEEQARQCRYCGRRTRWLLWRNDDDLWRAKCGVQGYIEVCESCRAWYRLESPSMIT